MLTFCTAEIILIFGIIVFVLVFTCTTALISVLRRNYSLKTAEKTDNYFSSEVSISQTTCSKDNPITELSVGWNYRHCNCHLCEEEEDTLHTFCTENILKSTVTRLPFCLQRRLHFSCSRVTHCKLPKTDRIILQEVNFESTNPEINSEILVFDFKIISNQEPKLLSSEEITNLKDSIQENSKSLSSEDTQKFQYLYLRPSEDNNQSLEPEEINSRGLQENKHLRNCERYQSKECDKTWITYLKFLEKLIPLKSIANIVT